MCVRCSFEIVVVVVLMVSVTTVVMVTVTAVVMVTVTAVWVHKSFTYLFKKQKSG